MTTTTSGIQTTLVTPAEQAIKLPDGMDLAAAAKIPVAFGTALYCLKDLARVRKSHVVMIGDACSDLGLAAIQISLDLGVEVSEVQNTPELLASC